MGSVTVNFNARRANSRPPSRTRNYLFIGQCTHLAPMETLKPTSGDTCHQPVVNLSSPTCGITLIPLQRVMCISDMEDIPCMHARSEREISPTEHALDNSTFGPVQNTLRQENQPESPTVAPVLFAKFRSFACAPFSVPRFTAFVSHSWTLCFESTVPLPAGWFGREYTQFSSVFGPHLLLPCAVSRRPHRLHESVAALE